MEKKSFWNHVNLTFYQRGRSLDARIFRKGLECWAKLRKRIIREYGEMYYIQTWECHLSGWPHVHIAMSNEYLYTHCTRKPSKDFDRLLGSMAVDTGFGRVGWLETLKSQAAMAGYLCKLARELTGRGKDYQVPVRAPRNFRRIRASVRLLPPPHKDPDITGILLRYPDVHISAGDDDPLSIQE